MKTVVALPGQGIGVEVVDATCEIIAAAGMPVKILTPPQIESPGSPVPEETRRLCREADAVLFGAAGPSTTAVVGWLRWEMEAWGGVRPAKFYTGILSAALMLDHLGLTAEATRLDAALARVYRDGNALTPDQGGTATTKHMAAEVLAAYRNQQ